MHYTTQQTGHGLATMTRAIHGQRSHSQSGKTSEIVAMTKLAVSKKAESSEGPARWANE